MHHTEGSLRRPHADELWIEVELWEVGYTDTVIHFISTPEKGDLACRRFSIPIGMIKHPVRRARVDGQRYSRSFVTVRRGFARLHGMLPSQTLSR
jgi:hypothetical protein